MHRASDERIDIGADAIAASIVPADGGRVARLAVDGVELLLGRIPDAPAIGWGSYPMVPWAGRIRDGRFRFRGRIVDLPRTLGGHAIHGVGFASPWTVTDRSPTSAALALDLPTDARWPFGGTSRQSIEVDATGVRLELSVTAADRAFPATIGWHPWFVKPERLDFRPVAMYRRDRHHVAVDELVEVPPGPWDDCFVNHDPVELAVGGVVLRLTSDCTEWVVYDERPSATCVEPQTGPPDAPNIRPHVVEAGETLTAWFRIDVVAG